jgi:hypothetical protein
MMQRMKKLLLLVVGVVLMLSCGNKTGQAVGNADSLATDSVTDMDAYRHTEAYIRQRIDTIYKFVGKLAYDEAGDRTNYNPSGINFDSAYCSQRYYALMTEASMICEETGEILYDYDYWVRGQDIADDWSYKVAKVYNITDSIALVDMIINNFGDQETTIALRYERDDWYVDDFSPSPDGNDDKMSLRNIIRDGLKTREKAKALVGSWGWVGDDCPELLLSLEMTDHGLKCTECTIYRLDGFDKAVVTFNDSGLWVNEPEDDENPKKLLYLHLRLDQNGDLTGDCNIRHRHNGDGYQGPITLRKNYFRYRDGAKRDLSDYAE